MKCYKSSAKSIRAYVLVMFCFAVLLLYGSKKVYAQEEQRADLYKNGVYMGNYKTMDAAFDQMTDSSADYKISMYGNQILSKTSWTKVISITIDGGKTGGF